MPYRLATKAVKVTCPYCQKVRTLSFNATMLSRFTGICQNCKHLPNQERKKLEALAPKAPKPEPEVPQKKQVCLKCDAPIPYNPALRLCETCRATNIRTGEDETYGTAIKVKVGYAIW